MGLISYFRNLYYDSRLKKAHKLLDEGKSPEAEKMLLSLVDKHPQAASQLATYYLSLSSSTDAKTDVDLFRKVVSLKNSGAGVYDAASYDSVLSKFVTHIEDRAKKCFESGSYNECFALASVLKETNESSAENRIVCSEAKIRLLYKDVEATKATDRAFSSIINSFKQEWQVCRDRQRAKDSALQFVQSLINSKRYYASNLLLNIVHGNAFSSASLDNAVLIVNGNDKEASSDILKDVVSLYAKEIILRKGLSNEDAVALFTACWKASNDVRVMMEVLRSVGNLQLKTALTNEIINRHDLYFSSSALLEQFSKWLYDTFDGVECLGYLERSQKLSYDVEGYYTQKVHSWSSKMSIDERITHLDHAQSLYPDSSIIIDDKLSCAQSYLDSKENDKAIAVSDSILTKREKAKLIKSHALCNLAGVEPNIDKRIELLNKAQATLLSCSGSEKAVVMTCIIDAFIVAAKKYYSGGETIKSYTVLTGLAKKGTEKAAFAIAEFRLKEVQAATSPEEKRTIVTDAIGELRRFSIPSIVNNVDYQQLWKEKTEVLLTIIQSLDNTSAVTNLESLVHEIDSSGLDDSVTIAIRPNVIKEIIKRKYLIARDLEKSNELSSASNLYKEINSLEAKKVPTLSAIRFAICKLKALRGSDVLEHRERIYTLLRKAADAYKSEKDELAYRFAFLLLKAGEDQEALSVLSEFLPKEDYLKKACEQGAVIKALAKLDDFNSKIDAVHNKSLSSEDTVFFINHMLEYGETIKPVLDLPRSTLGKYRNMLKNYAIFKLFDEGKYDVAFEKLIKEHKDYLDDYTALRNIALVCLNMAEANQISTNNYKEVISIWLTAIYQEQLFVKSLDYTSWDDQFTFSLYDAYGHFNDDSLGDLPDNVNNDYSEDNNVVQIKEVQRALLDRFEAAISNTQEHHEFYTSQKDVMDAFIALNLDIKCRIVAPYLAHKDEDVFQGISSALEQDRKKEYDNWEEVLSVGASYQMPQPIYNDYNKAKGFYADSIEAINALNSSKVGQAFSSSRIDLIKRFAKLSSALISYCNSKISALSANNKSEFKNNFTFYLTVCNALKDSTLSFMFSNFVMQYVVGQVNSNSMKKHEAADYILSILLLDKNNTRVKDNLTTLFEMLVRESSSESSRAVAKILEEIKTTDIALYGQLKQESEQAEIEKELGDIIEKITKKSISESSALQKVYSLYTNHPNDDGVCEIFAQLCTACIMKYIVKQASGSSTVVTILNGLKNNMSATFKKHRKHFKEAYDSIWNSLPADAKLTLLGMNPSASLNSSGIALKKGLDYFQSLGGFSTSSSFSDIFGLF